MRPFIDERLKSESEDLYAETLAFMERYLVTRVLSKYQGNQSKSAKVLGITRGSLRSKILRSRSRSIVSCKSKASRARSIDRALISVVSGRTPICATAVRRESS